MANAVDKDQAARELARKHYQIEKGPRRVFRLTSSPEIECSPREPIKLLEVNAATVTSGVMPLYFGPVPEIGIPFSSVIVEVTPEEFGKIQRNELQLPQGWTIGDELRKLRRKRRM